MTRRPAAASLTAAASPASPASEPDGHGDVLTRPIEELNLPLRAFNSLRREGVHTVGDLVARTPQQLLAIDYIGPASVDDIRQRLADHGLALSEPGGSGRPATGGPASDGSPARADGPAGDGPAGTGLSAEQFSDAATANGSGQPGTVFPADQGESDGPALRTVPPAPAEPAWQPEDDAIDLLSVAGLPVLRRALPAVAGVAVLAVVVLGLRRRRRRAGR